ncbi:MAG: hypothetical protein ACYSSN_12725 [Planctomycetota bacterium]|jgi:hypothetical protein
MKTQTRILLAIMFMIFVVFVGRSKAQDMDRWIVTIKAPAEQAVLRAGGIVDHVFELVPVIAIRIPEAALPGLERNPAVVSIEPDVVVTALPKPSEPPGQNRHRCRNYRGAWTESIQNTRIVRDTPVLE